MLNQLIINHDGWLQDVDIVPSPNFEQRPDDADIDLILLPRAATALTSISAPKTKVCLLIGPEGGFTHDEYENALAAGIKAVSLGPRILRTETAAAATIAVVQSMWGDFRRIEARDDNGPRS